MGLDNCGKTSIILSSRRGTNLFSYFSLKPTKGIRITDLEDEENVFAIWDFGGQEQYRDDYLEKINDYFDDVDKLIYVIDIQDTERYGKALEYLKNIIQLAPETLKNVEFSIYLHKFDPGLEGNEKFSNEAIRKQIIDKIIEIVPKTYSFRIFRTTIYHTFQRNLFYHQ